MITKVNVSGKEYSIQKVSPREFYRMKERAKVNGELSDEKFYDEVFENMIVSPKCTMDDFEEIEDIEKLMKEALQFQLKRGQPVTILKESKG